ncbi:ABC transporter ATP-binding protein [Acidobacterium sp. S8]|uniref:ABC transporter ATP-binding protein n=1 Tax=Acidobacterium sp. S8 TaxID=1641854 RepID=UPI00131B2A6D|nr:ATP-binding cassette domain-containing protein [Acidobacterium sp. S8]
MPAVYLQNVIFSYERNAPLLQIDELLIDEGERVFLYGPSGSGKTTLLGLVAGVLHANKGEVRVLGKDLTRLSSSARDRHRGAEMGYIFQSFNLIPYLSVRENIALSCHVHAKRMKRITASTLDGEILRIASRLDLDGFLNKPVTKLSTGQQQRVAIARAVIGAPRLVIADEPTSSLDRDRQESFLRLLIEVCNEARSTLIFVSHDSSLMSRFERHISVSEINQVVSC